ncbi:MAG: hypothetical protein CMC50_00295 [Flavobacteriaceae bacterium]|nr:hypothetical protein [Flavobacteriaceae bacterium]|tara:strand:+ start:1581 stop:1973 length:393 start_codon:yes stop_codon:yes gene_type:complete
MKTITSKKQLREFGLLIGFGFPIIIGWIIPAINGHIFRMWSLLIGFPLLILGLLKPSSLAYPYKVWMAIGLALGWVNSRLILGLVYFIILQPIAIVMKIFGYDPLRKKKSNERTYREIKKDQNFDLTRIF